MVAEYLGVNPTSTSLEDRVDELSRELSRQNGVLSEQLEHESIFQPDEYRRSRFVREMVANERENRQGRRSSDQYEFVGTIPSRTARDPRRGRSMSQRDQEETRSRWRDAEMNQEEEELHATIEDAFADRSMPPGRLIEKNVDLGCHLEARRVDEYFRKHGAVVDRHNSVLVAFIYMNLEASFWFCRST